MRKQKSFIIRRRIVGVYALVVAASFFISVAALTTARSLLGQETNFVSNESTALGADERAACECGAHERKRSRLLADW